MTSVEEGKEAEVEIEEEEEEEEATAEIDDVSSDERNRRPLSRSALATNIAADGDGGVRIVRLRRVTG